LDALDGFLQRFFGKGGSAGLQRDFFRERDPAFAAGIFESVGDFDGLGEAEGAEGEEVEGFSGRLVEGAYR